MQKHLITGIAVVAGLAVVAVFFIYNGSINSAANPTAAADATSTAGGLVVQDEVVGTGAEAASGDILSVNYTGKLQDGTVFDTSVGKQPINFPVGMGYVIPGWDQGLIGMKEGGKRILIIPPALAYGSEQKGVIPPNSTLIFEVELVKVSRPQ